MTTNENLQRAKTAIAGARRSLADPTNGGPEHASALALIGIGDALVAIAEQLGDAPDQPGS
jgi:hypothetical protein